MKQQDGQLIFSPTDLIRFMESPFSTWMDRYHLQFPGELTPDPDSEQLQLVAREGERHEARFLEQLRANGRTITEIARGEGSIARTRAAIDAGCEVIYQAHLAHAQFAGYADFLVRSSDGDYEVWDTKLARKTKPYYLIQLCCYAEILEHTIGRRPECLRVVLGDGTIQVFRTSEFFHYYGELKGAFLDLMQTFDPRTPPVPEPRADHGRWQSHADAQLLRIDHLYQVAGISVGQIKKLQAAGIETMTALAHTPLRTTVPQLDAAVLRRLIGQAQLQQRTKRDRATNPAAPAHYTVLAAPPEHPRRGLALLPPPNPGDIFFDMEGFPLAPDGGLEYLFGATSVERGRLSFHDWWAHDPQQEKLAFEGFIDWVVARRKRHPKLHIYHYAAYEVSALRRLMGRHATREAELDDLLRNDVFVDLYQVVRQGLQVGEPSYSIKFIERLYRPPRATVVATAGDSIVQYARWIESGEVQDPAASPILGAIRAYNKDDCDSTFELAQWLRARQSEAGIAFLPADRDAEAEERERSAQKIEQVRIRLEEHETLHQKLSALASSSRHSDRTTLARLLLDLHGFHRRENKPVWWRFFDRLDSTHDELKEDIACIGDATLQPPFEGTPVMRSRQFTYAFDPAQDVKIETGDTVVPLQHSHARLKVTSIDIEKGRITVKIGENQLFERLGDSMPDRTSFIPYEFVDNAAIADALRRNSLRLIESTADLPAVRQFLLRKPCTTLVRLRAGHPNWKADRLAIETARQMNGELLCIQGPPGTGKTYTAARMIADLVKRGHTVGISSNSHKAIALLVINTACVYGEHLRGIVKTRDPDDLLFTEFPLLQHPQRPNPDLPFTKGIVAGTAWFISGQEWSDRLDYLFIDEAGQVSTANFIAMAGCARNLVLIGDQMQLEQPIQGAHPGEAGSSALNFFLNGHATIPDPYGIFLPVTHRLPPDLCSVISELIYEGRLTAHPDTALHRLHLPAIPRLIRREAGLLFLPVIHDGNTQASCEEVECILALTRELLRHTHHRADGMTAHVTLDDILYVAPYNMQVARLRDALPPNARVGSVDKFQGQEAAVVIISMCSSFGEYGPRGLEFILNQNRINVALSRARTLAIVVGDPRIARAPAHSIERMRQLNAYCRIAGQTTAHEWLS